MTPLYISVAWSLIISYQLLTHNAVYSIINSLHSLLSAAAEFMRSPVDTIAFIHAFAWTFVLSSVIPAIILGKGGHVGVSQGSLSEKQNSSGKDVTDNLTNTDSETRSGASKRRGPGRLNFLHGASIVCFILAFVILWFGDTSTAILPAFDELIYVVIFTALGATLLGLGFNLTKVEKQMLTSLETVRLPQILVEEETSRAPELSPDSTHGQAEEIVPPAESLVQVQIRDESCETHLEKFDVTQPKHIVDCQC